MREELLLGFKDQKIIHFVALHEIVLLEEFVARRLRLANHHVATDAMVVSRQIALRQKTPFGRLHQTEKANLISQTGLY
jgi:hypothetical protein